MSELVRFSFQAELAIEAAHRMIDAYRAWQIRQNQRAAELFSYSCLAFGREINPASLSFDELKSSKISIDDPLKSEFLAALVETYLAIISSLDWQSSIGQDSSLVKYSGVLYSKIGPLIEGFRECLSLAEKAITYVEVADSSIGSTSVGSAVNPSDAKRVESAGIENGDAAKPKRTSKRRGRKPGPKKARELTNRQAEILKTVGDCEGSISKAAEILGIRKQAVSKTHKIALEKFGKSLGGRIKTEQIKLNRRGQIDIDERDARRHR